MYGWKAPLCIAIAAFYLAGCAATFSSFTDESTKAHIVRMKGNRLSGGLWRAELDAQRYEKDGLISYSLFVVYTGPLFLNIEPGKSLTLLIDGKSIAIEGSGSERHRLFISPGLVEEIAYYHNIDKELVRSIADAKHVTVEVRGTKSVLERSFKKKNFNNFKEFYRNYLEKDMVSNNRQQAPGNKTAD